MKANLGFKSVCLVMVLMTVTTFSSIIYAGSKDWQIFAPEDNYQLIKEGFLTLTRSNDYSSKNGQTFTLELYDYVLMKKPWKHEFGMYSGGGVRDVNVYCIKNGKIFGFDKEYFWAKCIDAKTGKLLWRTMYKLGQKPETEYRINIGITSSGKYFYLISGVNSINSDKACLYVFDSNTGTVLNRINVEARFIEENPVELTEGIIMIYEKEKLVMINAKTGKTAYSLDRAGFNPGVRNNDKELFGVYIDSNGFGYTRNAKDRIIKFNTKDGKIIWTSDKPFVGGFAHEDNDSIYLQSTSYPNEDMPFGMASYTKTDGKQKWVVERTLSRKIKVKTNSSDNTIMSRVQPPPEENPVPNCSNSFIEVKFLDDKVVVGIGYGFLGEYAPGLMIFRLSDGKEIVRKSESYSPGRIFQMADKRYILGVKITYGDSQNSYLTVIDTWTGKDAVLENNAYGINYQNNYVSYMTHIKDKYYFNVLDTTTGKRVWFLEDKDKDNDFIMTHNDKIIIIGGGLMDVFDIKTGKFIKRVK